MKWILGGVAALLLLGLVFVAFSGHLDCLCTVRVRGRVIDSQGRPVARAWVIAFAREWDAREPRGTLRRKELEDLDEEDLDQVLLPSGGGRTRDDGTFEIHAGVPFSVVTGPFGIELWEEGRAPFDGARVLRVERIGSPAVTLDCTKGTWREHEDGPACATIELGDVRLP